MRFAQPVLRRMLRTWLAAVCSLMNSVGADLAVAEPAATSREDLRPRGRRGRRERAARGVGAPSAATRREQRGHPDPLGERRRLGEQRRARAPVAALARASSSAPYS